MVTDMTVGRPSRVLWRFTIPMLGSIVFQQLYNIADSLVAGRFAGENALAAVGASYPVTMLFMAVAVGMNIGCSVVVSQLFGSHDYGGMRLAINTSFTASAALGVLLTAGGLLCGGLVLNALQTPANIFADAAVYLRVYIGGFLFLFMYNVATGIFTALGDSHTPFCFLLVSSIGNVVLDVLFVAGFGMGVAGVAWATFLAQGMSAVAAVFTLWRRLHRLTAETGNGGEHIPLFTFPMLKRILTLAVPSILQQSFVSVGNLFIQGLVNGYGSSVIAGYSAAIKLNTFAVTSFSTMSNAVSSFTAQNMGGGKPERVRSGFRAGLCIALCIAVPFVLLYLLGGGTMTGLFLREGGQKAVDTGRLFLLIVSPFYPCVMLKLLCDGVLRGAGFVRCFTISTFTDLVLRVVLAFALSPWMGSAGIWASWPIGWCISAGLAFYFYKTNLGKEANRGTN